VIVSVQHQVLQADGFKLGIVAVLSDQQANMAASPLAAENHRTRIRTFLKTGRRPSAAACAPVHRC
jgi:hypothetical protein